MCLPSPGEQYFGIRRSHRQIAHPNLRPLIERMRPCLAAISRLEHAPLRIRPIRVPQCSDIDDVRVLRIDHDPADLSRFTQPDVRPRLSAVDGLVDPVSRCQIAANVRLACARVNDQRIRRSHRQRSNRRHRLTVEHRNPCQTRICRLPDAAVDRPEVKRVAIPWHPGSRNCATSSVRTNRPPLHAAKQLRRGGLRRYRSVECKRKKSEQRERTAQNQTHQFAVSSHLQNIFN